MKNFIYTAIALAAAAFAISSCEDVPEPYSMPSIEDNTTPTVETKGDGTEANPYDVPAAILKQTTGSAYVEGYIVGYVSGMSAATGNVMAAPDTCTVATNILLAQTDTETDYTKCLIVQLPVGDVRTGINLKDNKANYKKQVVLYGELLKYFGTNGLKSTSYARLGDKEFGTKPGSEPAAPTTNPEGEGTKDKPYNVAAANKQLNDGTFVADKKIYIKGKVVSVDEINTSYGNATYYISDDGTAAGKLHVYRGYGLGGEKFTSADGLKAGDEVIVYGSLTIYNNTSKQVNTGSKLYKLNDKTAEVESSGEGQGTEQGGGEQPSGEAQGKPAGTVSGNAITVQTSGFGLENAAALTTVKLTDGTTITFDGGGNNNAPKYYTAGGGTIRMYPKNSFKVSAQKKIVSITLNCDEYNGALYNASGNVSATSGSVAVDGKNLNATGIDAESVTIKNIAEGSGTATQLRIKSFTITYAQ